jgi:hypothetical protein
MTTAEMLRAEGKRAGKRAARPADGPTRSCRS